jgi:putative hemolysin
MSGMAQTLLWMLLLVLANALFAGAEIAVVSVRRTRIRHLAEQGDPRARAVERLHAHVERFLATIQIGITLVGALGAALGGASLAVPLAAALRATPLGFLQHGADQIALGAVVLGYSFFSILVGELVPKSLALRHAEPMALTVAKPLLGLAALARPVVWLLTGAANLVLKPFSDRTSFTETRLTAEEIKLLIGEAVESGVIEKHGAEIIERAVDFGELTVDDVLVPRRQVVAIDLKTGPAEIRRVLLEEGHTRMPVVDGNLDKVVGYVTAKGLMPFIGEQNLIVLQDVMRPAFFVPTSMRALALLRALQKRHEHLAIAVDEYGGTAGIVTTEDLVEEIVGDIIGEDVSAPPLVKPEGEDAALVSALLPIREFNRALKADVPEHDEYDTVAGLLTQLAGTIPAVGQRFVAHGFEFTVTERSERRIKQVRVRRLSPQTPA